MNKKTLTIIVGIIIFILVGVGAYLYFFKGIGTKTTQPSAFPGEGQPVSGGVYTGIDGEGANLPFTPGSGAPLPRLYELHGLPVAGAGFIETGKGTALTVATRYIERGLGYIFETQLATYSETRIVNETRSRLSEAQWGNNGKSVAIRYLDETDGSVIKTHILNISGSAVTSFARGTSTESTSSDFLKTEEVFLPDYIPFMATAEDGTDKLFYLENGSTAGTGSMTNFKNTGTASIFSSSFTEWLPQFPSQKLVTLTTKPSANVQGYLFFLDTKTKALTKVLSGINGLTTLTSHNGANVLYSETKEGAPGLSVYDVLKKETRTLALQTLPEKCVWGTKNITIVYCAIPQNPPRATYPDQWYQGLLSFSDAVWKIDTKTGSTEKVFAPADFGAQSLDMINLMISSDDSSLLFINKVTSTPWVYRITESSILTLVPNPTITQSTVLPTSPLEGMKKISQ